ncbi:drug resistance transporter, EmrB/QacA subfamily [Methylobacterium sp. 4-46]|uniref:MDR family MFS transporter n=1 Tax=unclassified Methylobacterium TaxID=2615210 RepID=UPI000165CB86|nr:MULTISPECIES: MDR family MFS transporter [Methylobacterium]ACA20846.1 drug resistance transporter, EmrB/QacA subfamily [Methylobacterium sp. 4-46]WFT80001.1 MDR family MFS transporter [Methylobacterium nodulans]
MSGAAATAAGRASARDWLAVFGAILGAFTAILDIQITNASLADIQGALGASAEEGSWISTAYLMAEIIVIPLTGWLSSVIGLRRYLAANTLLFIGFSVACALSTSLPQMIVFRAGQGFTGGVLIPTAIVIVRTRLPRAQQAVGIALFGLTATFAPAIGPTVGGWLTDHLSWHYIFYLNLLFGPAAVVIQLAAFDPVPARWGELLRGDWIGIGFMATGLPALTFVLEEGQRKDWFGSPVIVEAALLAAGGIAGFIIRELTAERPFINLRVLAHRSVGGACLLMTVLGAVSFGSIYIIPLYCAQIQGYNAQQIGTVVMWSGLPQLLLFPAMPLIMRAVDARLLVIAGTLFFVASCWINVGLSHDVGMDQLILPQLLRAIGQPLFTIPLSQLSTAGLAPRDTADASALSNMMRNLGGSIGIAMLSTVIDRREHLHFSVLAEAITRNGTRTQERLAALAAGLHAHMPDPTAAKGAALAMLARQVRREATVMAYADGFWLVGASLVLSLAVVAVLRKPARAGGPVEAH